VTNAGQINITIESFGILITIVLLILLATGGDRKSKLNRLFIRLVICNIAALSFDMLAWGFNGSAAACGFAIVRAAKFTTYVLQYLLIPLLADYVTALVEKNIKIDMIIPRVMYALFVVAAALVTVSQFNGMYYYFDQNNMYRLGEFFDLSQGFGALFLLLITVFILRHRKSIGVSDTRFLLSYAFFPIIATIIQMVAHKELEFIFMATTLSAVACYGGIQARQAKLQKEQELIKINKLEKELNEGRIATMLSQIQPHFLFNALLAIQELCVADPETARQTVIEFSQYLRGNLDSLGLTKPILFERELKHVETYLAIEKKRFAHKLNIIFEIDARDFMLPALSLQLIVENAVHHGITKRSKGGTVSVKTAETETAYVITVTDDGVGFDGGVKKDDGRPRAGIENVRRRLDTMCGGTLTIESAPDAGTTAVISLPKGDIYGK